MFNTIVTPKQLRTLHVWLAGLVLSGALAYKLQGVSPLVRFFVAAGLSAMLNVLLGRRIPALNAWIFVRRRLTAGGVLVAIVGAATWRAHTAWTAGGSNILELADLQWLPLVVVASFAFRQGFARAAGPRHVGTEWLSRRARTNWLLAAVVLGMPRDAGAQACFLLAVAIGVTTHFALRDLHYRRAERRRAAKRRELAANAIRHHEEEVSPRMPEPVRIEKTFVAAGVMLLTGRTCEALRHLESLLNYATLTDAQRAKVLLVAARAYFIKGEIVNSTRALEDAARFDPECPITIAAQLHLAAAHDEVAANDQRTSPISRALLAPRSASGVMDEVVRMVYRVNQTFFQVALGAFYLRRGHLGLAFESLDRAIERDPASSVAHLEMGNYWLVQRDKAEDDDFRKDALAAAHIHLRMCVLLEGRNRNSIAARRAIDAIASSSARSASRKASKRP